jgi:hypothetical protein
VRVVDRHARPWTNIGDASARQTRRATAAI